MALALLVLEIVAPVFLLAGIGVVWVKSGLEYRVAFVSMLAMKLALPALIFMSLVATELTLDQIARIAVAGVVAHLVLIPVFWLLTEILKIDRPTFLAPPNFWKYGQPRATAFPIRVWPSGLRSRRRHLSCVPNSVVHLWDLAR